MPHDPRKLLEDIRLAAMRVQQFTAAESADSYMESVLLRSAVERQIEIVGEALNRLLKLSPELATRITDYRRIIDFRNYINHVYHRIDHKLVWGVVEKDVPILLREVEEMLTSLGDE
jgi:uncharacterized protein with HEPN domain